MLFDKKKRISKPTSFGLHVCIPRYPFLGTLWNQHHIARINMVPKAQRLAIQNMRWNLTSLCCLSPKLDLPLSDSALLLGSCFQPKRPTPMCCRISHQFLHRLHPPIVPAYRIKPRRVTKSRIFNSLPNVADSIPLNSSVIITDEYVAVKLFLLV
jgi:hypothetical protein